MDTRAIPREYTAKSHLIFVRSFEVIDVLGASCSSLSLRLPLLFRPFLLNEIVYFPLHLILLEYQISAGGFERGYPFV
jgi:hypothetical protein